jgi:peroxiredoxin
MMDNATLESRLAALRDATAERLPQLAKQNERLFAELGEALLPTARVAGDRAPDFDLTVGSGEVLRLSWLLDVQPAVICFYRGHWDPYSNVHLDAMQQEAPQIRSLGAEVLFVGPETPQNAAKMSEKWGGTIPVLSDADGRVMDAYGISFEVPDYLREDYGRLGFPDLNPATAWRLPVTATYIVDRLGVIRGAHVDPDYTRRLEIGQILATLQRIRPRVAA